MPLVAQTVTGHRTDRMIDQYFRKDNKKTKDVIENPKNVI